MKVKGYRIMRVVGRGSPHPMPDLQEMCRYDCAFISLKQEQFPRIVVFPKLQDRHGALAGVITHARWGTFQMVLNACSGETDQEVLASLKADPASWVTYQHPQDDQGATLYQLLAPFTFLEWLTAKTMMEVYLANNRYCSTHLLPMEKTDNDTLYTFKCLKAECDKLCYVPK